VALALALAAGGCALRSDVTRVERQLAESQRATARADSAITANLAALARMFQSIGDSVAGQREQLTRMRGDLHLELINVQQQLVAIQELTGQSQQRLTELRAQLDQRSAQLGGAASAPGQPGGAAPTPAAGPPGAATADPSADQLLELSLQQLRRGSPATARAGFAEFLRRFAAHPRAADAEFFTGEAWSAERQSDSAAAAYRIVAQRWPQSPRAPAALYKLGVMAAAAGKVDEARQHFTRVTTAYPGSEEAALARDQLRALPPAR
jgi:tol-pal system protein YbgF